MWPRQTSQSDCREGGGCPGTENERSVNSQRDLIFPIVSSCSGSAHVLPSARLARGRPNLTAQGCPSVQRERRTRSTLSPRPSCVPENKVTVESKTQRAPIGGGNAECTPDFACLETSGPIYRYRIPPIDKPRSLLDGCRPRWTERLTTDESSRARTVLRAINPRHNPTPDTLNWQLKPFRLRLSLARSTVLRAAMQHNIIGRPPAAAQDRTSGRLAQRVSDCLFACSSDCSA